MVLGSIISVAVIVLLVVLWMKRESFNIHTIPEDDDWWKTREIRFLGDLQTLNCKEGDVFVLTYSGQRHRTDVNHIQTLWKSVMPGFKLIVLNDDMKLGVIHKEEVNE